MTRQIQLTGDNRQVAHDVSRLRATGQLVSVTLTGNIVTAVVRDDVAPRQVTAVATRTTAVVALSCVAVVGALCAVGVIVLARHATAVLGAMVVAGGLVWAVKRT